MTSLHTADGSANQFGAEMNPALDFLQTFDANGDPVEAYFECISQCSLDDGECVTVCTTILREKS
jgi:hypothetical protein